MKVNINKIVKPYLLLKEVAEVLEKQNKSKGLLYAHDDVEKTISEINTNTGEVEQFEVSIITHDKNGAVESVKLRKI